MLPPAAVDRCTTATVVREEYFQSQPSDDQVSGHLLLCMPAWALGPATASVDLFSTKWPRLSVQTQLPAMLYYARHPYGWHEVRNLPILLACDPHELWPKAAPAVRLKVPTTPVCCHLRQYKTQWLAQRGYLLFSTIRSGLKHQLKHWHATATVLQPHWASDLLPLPVRSRNRSAEACVAFYTTILSIYSYHDSQTPTALSPSVKGTANITG